MAIINFDQAGSVNGVDLGVDFELSNPTSLQFGPDGRLYVAEQNGSINAFNVELQDGEYVATASEVLALPNGDEVVKSLQNHNDDGTLNNSINDRQVTGILVAGTAENPVLYVSSSDPRISIDEEVNLDTNSGVLTRVTWTGSEWESVDIIRGLPRSEENSSNNGMVLSPDGSKLYLQVGANTNNGAPSEFFSYLSEYALSGTLLEVDLDDINNRPILTDDDGGQNSTPRQYIYDLPTLDDPSVANDGVREDADGLDVDGPFGGNDGFNQAILPADAPLRIFADGFRNPYDIVLTESGNFYTVDNSSNLGLGGNPLDENDIPTEQAGAGEATNRTNDGGTGDPEPLFSIEDGGYYGHPTPVRANQDLEWVVYDDDGNPDTSLTPNSFANVSDLVPDSVDIQDGFVIAPSKFTDDPTRLSESGVRIERENDPQALTLLGSSSNGLVEYTGDAFDGALQGALLVTQFNGNTTLLNVNEDGTALEPLIDPGDDGVLGTADDEVLAEDGVFPLISGQSLPLDVTTGPDGSVWVAEFGNDNINVFTPTPNPGPPGEVLYRVNAGGPEIAALDDEIDWAADTSGDNSSFLIDPGSNTTASFPAVEPGQSVPDNIPGALFDTERWDQIGGTEMQWAFDVEEGNYDVRLYVGNGFGGTSEPGTRVFDVAFEGDVLSSVDNIDLSDQFGHEVGGVISNTVEVTDGTLNIDFLHDIENPLVNAIEIVEANDPDPLPPVEPIEIEAETITDTTGYRIENNEIASGGSLLSLVGGAGGEVGTATFNFTGEAGEYNVVIGTFDEADGQASLELAQNGSTIGSTVLDQNPGGNAISEDTKVEIPIASNITIANGDSFTVTGLEQASEHARFDFIRFESTSEVPPVEPPDGDPTITITSEASVTVEENQIAVVDVESTDSGGDTEGSGLTYSLSGGTDQDAFVIDENTGVLSFANAPDFESPGDSDGDNVYDVEVTVTNAGGLTDTQILDVTVSDVEPETPPLIRWEGESADSISNYRTEDIEVASGGQALSFLGGSANEVGSATFGFNEAAGNYDIVLGTFDEGDGIAQFVVELNDGETGTITEIGTLELDASLGSNLANAQTIVNPTVASNIALTPGDQIIVNGFENGGEHARLDFVGLQSVI